MPRAPDGAATSSALCASRSACSGSPSAIATRDRVSALIASDAPSPGHRLVGIASGRHEIAAASSVSAIGSHCRLVRGAGSGAGGATSRPRWPPRRLPPRALRDPTRASRSPHRSRRVRRRTRPPFRRPRAPRRFAQVRQRVREWTGRRTVRADHGPPRPRRPVTQIRRGLGIALHRPRRCRLPRTAHPGDELVSDRVGELVSFTPASMPSGHPRRSPRSLQAEAWLNLHLSPRARASSIASARYGGHLGVEGGGAAAGGERA